MKRKSSLPMGRASQTESRMKTFLKFFYLLPLLVAVGIIGYLVWHHFERKSPAAFILTGKPFLSVPIDGLTADLFTQGNQLRTSGNDIYIEFRDPYGALADAGKVGLELNLSMPGIVMHSIGRVLPSGTVGQYHTMVEPQMGGSWVGKISVDGPHGHAETNFTALVK